MYILVCGGRKFNNYRLLKNTLDNLMKERKIKDPIIVHGRAQGADLLARAWAKEREFRDRGFPAKWLTYNNSAGPIRNRQMLDEQQIDLVVAFVGGGGTANMVNQARERGIEVYEVKDVL